MPLKQSINSLQYLWYTILIAMNDHMAPQDAPDGLK